VLEGRQHSGCPSHVPPLVLAYKNKGGRREKKRGIERKKRGENRDREERTEREKRK